MYKYYYHQISLKSRKSTVSHWHVISLTFSLQWHKQGFLLLEVISHLMQSVLYFSIPCIDLFVESEDEGMSQSGSVQKLRELMCCLTALSCNDFSYSERLCMKVPHKTDFGCSQTSEATCFDDLQQNRERLDDK